MKQPRAEVDREVQVLQRQALRTRALSSIAVAASLTALVSQPARAQESAAPAQRRVVAIQPRIGVTETLTDNVDTSVTSKQSALVTQLSPGLKIDSRTGRVRGTLDYALNGIVYSGGSQKSQIQNALSAIGSAELIEQALFIEGQASIAQQPLSAFGRQSSSNTLVNDNNREVANLSVSPYWRGRLGSFATFELRGNAGASNMRKSIIGDGHNDGATFSVSGLSAGALQWSASLSTQESYFRVSEVASRSQVAKLSLTYRPDVDFTFAVNGGPERNNYGTVEMRTSNSYGASASWTPSSRTRASLDWQHHDYGDSHSVVLEHRRSRSVWRYSDVQSVTLAAPTGSSQPIGTTLYNLFYQQCLAAQVDPASCSLSVAAYLLARGLDPNLVVLSGFTATAPTLQRMQDLSFSYDLQRTSVLFSLSQSNTALLNEASPGSGDFAQSSRVRQQGMALSLSHRLTPLSNLFVALSVQRTTGDTAALSNSLRSLTASWSTRFGQKLNATFGARHSSFTGPSGYSENALTANLVQQF